MTEEQKKEMILLDTYPAISNYSGGILIDTWWLCTKRINWLRKNGFDCDGLLDAGLALDYKTLKEATV